MNPARLSDQLYFTILNHALPPREAWSMRERARFLMNVAITSRRFSQWAQTLLRNDLVFTYYSRPSEDDRLARRFDGLTAGLDHAGAQVGLFLDLRRLTNRPVVHGDCILMRAATLSGSDRIMGEWPGTPLIYNRPIDEIEFPSGDDLLWKLAETIDDAGIDAVLASAGNEGEGDPDGDEACLSGEAIIWQPTRTLERIAARIREMSMFPPHGHFDFRRFTGEPRRSRVCRLTSLTRRFDPPALRSLEVTGPQICQTTFLPFNTSLLPNGLDSLKLKSLYVDNLSGSLPPALQEVTLADCDMNLPKDTFLASASRLEKLSLIDSEEYIEDILDWALGINRGSSVRTVEFTATRWPILSRMKALAAGPTSAGSLSRHNYQKLSRRCGSPGSPDAELTRKMEEEELERDRLESYCRTMLGLSQDSSIVKIEHSFHSI